MCKMMTSLDAFFSFSKFSFSWLLEGNGGGGIGGFKWQKMAQGGKKICILLGISGTILHRIVGFF